MRFSWRAKEENYPSFLLHSCIHCSLPFWEQGTAWDISMVQIYTEEMTKGACSLPPALYLTKEGEDPLMFFEELGNGEVALLDPT